MIQYRSILILPSSPISPGEKQKVSLDFTLKGAEKWAETMLEGLTEEEAKTGYVRVYVIEEKVLRDVRREK